MNQLVATGSSWLAPRVARKSDDYVNEIMRRRGVSTPGLAGMAEAAKKQTMTHEAKMRHLALVLRDQVNGIQRLGVGMIGPIQLMLRYQGITRNVLIEDPVTPGTPVMYDVWDDLGQAYIMSGVEGEVRVQPFEGKRVQIQFFRIASRPAIRKEDLYYLRINAVEQAQDQTKQAIMMQEDSHLLVVVQAAEVDYSTRPDHTVTPNHNVIEASGYFTPQSLYTSVAQTDMHMLPSGRVLVNPMDYRDFFRWDINTTGWAFKDRVVSGEQIDTFGEFQFQRSIMVPQGKMWVLPNPDFLGAFPVLYSLDVEENHQIESFWKGWVFDEMVSYFIGNPRGIASVTKS
jgi:hypothetical protein